MSTLTKRHLKKPASKPGKLVASRAASLRSPKPLAVGKPTAGFLAGTIKIGPSFDPQSPAYADREWKT